MSSPVCARVCVCVLWLWLHTCSRCLASPLAQLVCPCKTTLGLRMKYETLAPYFTLAVAGLKDGSLDVCLPFPSTLSFSLSLQPAPTYTSSFSLPTLSAPFPPPRARYWQPNTHMCYLHWERERYRLPWEDCCGCTVRSLAFMGLRAATRRIDFCIPHTTKNWFISLFLCMCLVMLVISRYALPFFFFLYWQNFSVSFTPSFSVHYLIPGLNRRDTRLLYAGAALPLVDSFDVLYGLCAFRAGWYFLTDI